MNFPKLSILITILFFMASGFFMPLTSNAQPSATPGTNNLRMLKIEISTLMIEKSQLEEENLALHQEYATIKKLFAQKMREVLETNPGILTSEKKIMAHEQWIEKLGKDLAGLEDEYLINKFKNAYMARELIDETQLQSLRRLHLADLSYQRRDYELQLKWAQYAQDQKAMALKEEWHLLNKQYQENLERERALSVALEEEKGKKLEVESDKSTLKKRNHSLKEEAQKIQSQLKEQRAQNAKLETEHADRLQTLLDDIKSKKKQKTELSELLTSLEEQRQALTFTVQESLSRTHVLRALTEEMVILDRENQTLRKKIIELENQTSLLKR